MNLLEQLESRDLAADWVGPDGLFARAAAEIRRLQLELAEAHVDAGTIDIGEDQLDAAENSDTPHTGPHQFVDGACDIPGCSVVLIGAEAMAKRAARDYAERRGWKRCMSPECLATPEQCQACHFLYQKFAEPTGNAPKTWLCNECPEPCVLTIVCKTKFPVAHFCPVVGVTRDAKWKIQTPLQDWAERSSFLQCPRAANLYCGAPDVECKRCHLRHEYRPGSPTEPPVAEAEDAAREVDPTEPVPHPVAQYEHNSTDWEALLAEQVLPLGDSQLYDRGWCDGYVRGAKAAREVDGEPAGQSVPPDLDQITIPVLDEHDMKKRGIAREQNRPLHIMLNYGLALLADAMEGKTDGNKRTPMSLDEAMEVKPDGNK